MNWGTIFGKLVLDRGRAYYDAGKVKDLRYANGAYHAIVRGRVPYRVEIQVTGNTIRAMKCSCPAAESGGRCKHMAATLIAIERHRAQARLREQNPIGMGEEGEENEAVSPEKDGVEVPFPRRERPQGEYWYYDLSRMTEGLIFWKSQCARARQLVEDKAVILKEVVEKSGEPWAKATGLVKESGRNYTVELWFDRQRIRRALCSVADCRKYYTALGGEYGFGTGSSQPQLCVHETALLYLLADYVKTYNPGDTTDAGAIRLLEYFRGVHGPTAALSLREGQELTLSPRLEFIGEEMKVGFRIGREGERPYLVKNLTELVSCVRRRGEMEFGARLEADFSRDHFTRGSRPIYELIQQAVQDRKFRGGQKDEWYEEESVPAIRNHMPLYGTLLDAFFEMFAGQRLEYQSTMGPGGKRQGEVLLQERRPHFHLTIGPDRDGEGVFQGIRASGRIPVLWEGIQYLYFLDGDCLNRVIRSDMEEVLPFYAMARDGELKFRVGRKHLTEFYYTALPVLSRYGTVHQVEEEEVRTFLPPEAAFAFYLDAEDGRVTCRAEAVYGKHRVSVLDVLKNDLGTLKEDFRDSSRETAVAEMLTAYLPGLDQERDLFHSGDSEDAVYDLLDRGVDRLLAVGEVHTTDAFRHLHIRRKPKLSVGVSVKSNIMDLDISSEDISKEELMEILQSYRKKKRFHRLRNGDFLNMDDENLELLTQLMEDLRLSPRDFVKGKMQLPAYRALYLEQMLEQSQTLYSTRDSRFKQLVKEFKTVEDADFFVPEHLRGIMRNYQKVGYRWLRTLDTYGFGGILADDMGLGKTLQLISVLSAYKAEGGVGTSLIICPASLIYNWQEECRRFAPELKVSLIVGTQSERMVKLKQYREADVLITSYDLLKRDIAEYEDCEFVYQALDEAQYIKNHATAASKAVKIIRSRTRYALTGTPIENRLSELWSIFDYLMPGFLYGYDTFKQELEKPITRSQDEAASTRLRKMVSPFILRRLKKQVLKDLPDKLEETRYARLEERQQQIYDAQVLRMRDMIENQSEEAFARSKFAVLAELTRIRQICCDPSLCLEDYEGGSAKREACMDLIRSAMEGEHKMLVFSQFTSMLELLERDLEAQKISYYKITGATPKEVRVELVRAFNEDDTPVFLISLKAGGTGLNLTGADVVIHYDPWWNLAVQNQATDRAHRIGQKKIVSVYKLIVKDSIEEKILHMQQSKKDLADGILSGDTRTLSSLTREELLELIRG